MITWHQWVKASARNDSIRQISSKIGVSPSSISKWFRTGKPPVAAVVDIARAYEADIVVGLVTAGILTERDVQQDVARRLRHVPTNMLIAELGRRSAGGEVFDDTEPPEWSMTGLHQVPPS